MSDESASIWRELVEKAPEKGQQDSLQARASQRETAASCCQEKRTRETPRGDCKQRVFKTQKSRSNGRETQALVKGENPEIRD